MTTNDKTMRYLKIVALTVIIIGSYLGIRYIGVVFHYTCAMPQEDCPPPFRIVGDLAFVLSGGELVPLWTR